MSAFNHSIAVRRSDAAVAGSSGNQNASSEVSLRMTFFCHIHLNENDYKSFPSLSPVVDSAYLRPSKAQNAKRKKGNN